jgi:hypothetical protein
MQKKSWKTATGYLKVLHQNLPLIGMLNGLLVLSFFGCLGWLFVAFIWKDRALIILNAIACFILLTGLLTKLFTV